MQIFASAIDRVAGVISNFILIDFDQGPIALPVDAKPASRRRSDQQHAKDQ